MHFVNILPLLLAPLAAASSAAAGLSARDDNVNIFDSPNFRGQHREITINGICQNLGHPYSTPGRGIQSLRFSTPEGNNCEIYRTWNCLDSDPVRYFEDQQRIRITAGSIRCSRNSGNDENDD